jgi:hypothetical protein
MQRSILLFTGTAVLMLISSGCALVDQKVPLTYNQGVADSNADKYGVIQVEKPTSPDLQKKSNGLFVVGNVKNTYGMKTADTVTGDSVSDWVANALSIELKTAGFTPQVVEDIGTSGQGIKTRVLKVWVEQDPGFWTVGAIGEVQLRIALYRDGNKIKEFDVESKGQGNRAMMGDDATKRESLRIALEASMKKAIPIITETYSKE